MKGIYCCLLLVITVAVAYCAWRQGALADLLPVPRTEYVTREPALRTWFDESRDYEAQRDADWRRWRQYDAAYQRGLVHSGIDDIDESVVATYGMDMAAPQLTPPRWRARWDAGSKWCDSREDTSGPSEECVDWQGRDAGIERKDARPAWVEPRRESQYRRAMRHLLFGVDDAEKL